MSRAVSCPCLNSVAGVYRFLRDLLEEQVPLATIGKALVHIFNWEGDCKTEDNQY